MVSTDQRRGLWLIIIGEVVQTIHIYNLPFLIVFSISSWVRICQRHRKKARKTVKKNQKEPAWAFSGNRRRRRCVCEPLPAIGGVGGERCLLVDLVPEYFKLLIGLNDHLRRRQRHLKGELFFLLGRRRYPYDLLYLERKEIEAQ